MVASLRIDASRAWVGLGETPRSAVSVVADRDAIVSVGPTTGAPEADRHLVFPGFLMPAVADRHVHIRLADPAAVLAGGVAAVRDLAWVPDEIFPLAERLRAPELRRPVDPGRRADAHGAGRLSDDRSVGAAGDGARAPGAGARAACRCRARSAGGRRDQGLAQRRRRTHAERRGAGRDRRGRPTARPPGHGPRPGRRAGGTRHRRGGRRVRAHAVDRASVGRPPRVRGARRPRIVSTLDILSYGEITPELRVACDNLVRFRAAGGTVVYGTDLGNGPIPAGIDLREALLLHEAVRMPPEDVLDAMTAASIEVGAPADLIGLGDDPLAGVEALGDLRLVVRAGRVDRPPLSPLAQSRGRSSSKQRSMSSSVLKKCGLIRRPSPR